MEWTQFWLTRWVWGRPCRCVGICWWWCACKMLLGLKSIPWPHRDCFQVLRSAMPQSLFRELCEEPKWSSLKSHILPQWHILSPDDCIDDACINWMGLCCCPICDMERRGVDIHQLCVLDQQESTRDTCSVVWCEIEMRSSGGWTAWHQGTPRLLIVAAWSSKKTHSVLNYSHGQVVLKQPGGTSNHFLVNTT